ncbi:SH3 domain-containing protein [Streptomyces violascens]|uniref:SH3 domain-containing protein n=1 Tax=Streptomyces violascens TaxID=67381 RepID=UPI0036626A93
MTRRHVPLLAPAMLAVPLMAMSTPAVAAAPQHVVPVFVASADFCRITGSSATVRAEPRRQATALGTAEQGDTCVAHGWANGDGAWVKVTMRRTGVTGYVHSSLVAWGKEELTKTGP